MRGSAGTAVGQKHNLVAGVQMLALLSNGLVVADTLARGPARLH